MSRLIILGIYVKDKQSTNDNNNVEDRNLNLFIYMLLFHLSGSIKRQPMTLWSRKLMMQLAINRLYHTMK